MKHLITPSRVDQYLHDLQHKVNKSSKCKHCWSGGDFPLSNDGIYDYKCEKCDLRVKVSSINQSVKFSF